MLFVILCLFIFCKQVRTKTTEQIFSKFGGRMWFESGNNHLCPLQHFGFQSVLISVYTHIIVIELAPAL